MAAPKQEDYSPATWEKRATDMQQQFLGFFGQNVWDAYQPNETEFLQKKVGYALYGQPTELPFTVAERITSAVMEGNMKNFLPFLGKEDWASLQSSAYEFTRTIVSSTLFESKSKESKCKTVDTICTLLREGNKQKFLNYLPESYWETYQKSVSDFVEEQVRNVLFKGVENQSNYTIKQNEIITNVANTIKRGDMPTFCFYLPEVEWYSIQNSVCEHLEKKIGKSLYGTAVFGYSKEQRKVIDIVCTSILREDKENFLEFLAVGEWQFLRNLADKLLRYKIGDVLFGPPGKIPARRKENQTGYTAKQLENIMKICSVIIKEDKHGREKNPATLMSIVFLCLEVLANDTSDVLPVAIFRVPNDSNGSSFIDSSGRVYKNWNDFLENNELPQCRYCFPSNGIYQFDENDSVFVEFGKTPACKLSKKFLNAMDITSSGVGLGTAAILVASGFVPVAGPLVVASVLGGSTAGIYSMFRSSGTLIDRAQHNQSLGLGDSEARSCWISLVGSAVGTAAMGATTAVTKLTQAGQVVGRAGRIATTVLNCSSLIINGLGIIHGAFALHSKYKDGELTPLDVFQFSANVFFFTHSAMNMKTADTIIKETQTEVIQKFDDSLRSNRHRKMFRKVSRNTQKDMEVVEGRAAVIRAIRKIDNKDDFFAGLVRSDKDFRKAGAKVKLTESGLVDINGKLKIDPMKFSQVNREQRQIILAATQDLASGNISHQDFVATADAIFQEHNISLTLQERNEYISSINSVLNDSDFNGISTDGKRIIQMANLYEIATIYQILTNMDRKLHSRIVEVAARLCELQGWTNESNFVRVLVFVCRTVSNIAERMEEKYQQDLFRAQCEQGADFNRESFDEMYHISGRRFDHFCSVVLEEFISEPVILQSLKDAFNLDQEFTYTPITSGEEIAGTNSTPSMLNNSHLQEDAIPCPVAGQELNHSPVFSVEEIVDTNVTPSIVDSSDFMKDATSSPGTEEITRTFLYSKERPLKKSRVFWKGEDLVILTSEEIFDTVEEVTGHLVDHTNCFIDHEGINVNATVLLPEGCALYVGISCDVTENSLSAYASYIQ